MEFTYELEGTQYHKRCYTVCLMAPTNSWQLPSHWFKSFHAFPSHRAIDLLKLPHLHFHLFMLIVHCAVMHAPQGHQNGIKIFMKLYSKSLLHVHFIRHIEIFEHKIQFKKCLVFYDSLCRTRDQDVFIMNKNKVLFLYGIISLCTCIVRTISARIHGPWIEWLTPFVLTRFDRISYLAK